MDRTRKEVEEAEAAGGSGGASTGCNVAEYHRRPILADTVRQLAAHKLRRRARPSRPLQEKNIIGKVCETFEYFITLVRRAFSFSVEISFAKDLGHLSSRLL